MKVFLLSTKNLFYLIKKMKPKLLAFLEDLVSQERMIKFNENKYHMNDISESLKAENEKRIRLCDEVLKEITKQQNIGDI